MSIRITPFCRQERISKDKTTIIYLRFTINRKSRYVSTGIRIPVVEWDFDEQTPKASSQNIKCELFERVNFYQKQIKRLEALDIKVTLDNLLPNEIVMVGSLVSDGLNQTINQLKSVGKFSSAARCKVVLTHLQRLGIANMRFDEMSVGDIQKYESALRSWGYKPNSIATMVSVFKAAYNKALARKAFVCRENPFLNYNIGRLKEPTRKRAILKEDIHRLMNAPLPLTHSPYTELSRDLFLFSYFSAGMNFRDVAMLRCADYAAGRIFYSRKKTGKMMSCRVLPQAQEIMDKYCREGKTEEDYIFPILDRCVHQTALQIRNRLNKVLRHINRELKGWGKRLGLKFPLTTYVARHTYATVLKRSGVNIALISESLGHSDISTTQIYLDSFENSQIDEAMKNLL